MSGATSNRLKKNKEKILSQWELRALKEIPSAETAQSLVLRNSLPIYLDHLADAIATDRSMTAEAVTAHDIEGVRIGRLHGADRAGSAHYLLAEVISEYHILREVLFQILETEAPLGTRERDVILNSIEQAVNDAAVRFTEVHAEIQQKFIATLTHDLKNPITAAKMNAQLVLKRADKPESCISSAGRIIVSLNRLESMVHDLLDASRLRAGEPLTLEFTKGDLEAIVREVVEEMTVVNGDRFVFSADADLEGFWGCDGLRRALENLLGNAVKYSTPQTKIFVSARKIDGAVRLTVHNEGPAIPPAEQKILFQQYRRAKNAQDSAKTGWGLGLTLVKGVVDAHGGRVWVESSPGKGTSFILELPFRAL